MAKPTANLDRALQTAIAHFHRKQYPAARGAALKVLRANSKSLDAHFLMGAICSELGKHDDAIRHLRDAIALAPRDFAARANLARALLAAGRADDALEVIAAVIDLAPREPNLYLTQGNVLLDLDRLDDALVAYGKAVKLDPKFADAHANAANVLMRQKDYEAAALAFDRVIELEPQSGDALAGRFRCDQQFCQWNGYDLGRREFLARISRHGRAAPFLAKLVTDDNGLLRASADAAVAALAKGPEPAVLPLPSRDRRLRVAYIGADFRRHATANLATGLFEQHDKETYEVFAISYGKDDGSAERARLERAFEHFENVHGQPASAIAARIRELGITIAIDLMGHTRDAKLDIFHPRVAPIQISFLGFPGTTGIRDMDYLVVDPFLATSGVRRSASEKLVVLPDCYQPNDDKKEIAAQTPKRAEVGLPDASFVFCCFNQSLKITPDIFAAWMRILQAVPRSVLWLLVTDERTRANLRAESKRHDVDPARLVFGGNMDRPEHLARYRLADLFLDTFPYGAHTTASDALWVGCPVLTRSGESFASRVCGSLLNTMGLPELVTATPADYEATAVRLADHPAELASLRERLAANRATTALFDTKLFCRNMERAFDEMVRNLRAGRRPAEIVLANDPSGA